MLEHKNYPLSRSTLTRLKPGQWSMHRVRSEGKTCVLSLPARVRAYLGIKAGDHVAIRLANGEMLLRKVDLDSAIAESIRISTQEG